MNRREHRVLRAIEKNLTDEDPELAALLRPSGCAHGRRARRLVGALSMLLALLTLIAGSGLLLLTTAGSGAGWTTVADRDH